MYFLSYFSLKLGYLSGIFYLIVVRLYGFLLPIIAIFVIYFFLKRENVEEVTRERPKSSLSGFIVLASIVFILVYLVVGDF